MDYVQFVYRPLAARAARQVLVGRNLPGIRPCWPIYTTSITAVCQLVLHPRAPNRIG